MNKTIRIIKIWLSEKEAAVYTSLSMDKIQEARKSGAIPHYSVGRRILYNSKDLDTYIRSNIVHQTNLGDNEQ